MKKELWYFPQNQAFYSDDEKIQDLALDELADINKVLAEDCLNLSIKIENPDHENSTNPQHTEQEEEDQIYYV